MAECSIEERDYWWRFISKAYNQRSRHARVCVLHPEQPREKLLTPETSWNDMIHPDDM